MHLVNVAFVIQKIKILHYDLRCIVSATGDIYLLLFSKY